MKIELNEQFKQALEVMENTSSAIPLRDFQPSARNVFVTGKAGTGKSTLLDYFRNTTKKRIVVLAPTGVAAVNVAGQTIHSFFRFKPDITISKIKKKTKDDIYKKLDAIVIDEISMVRADLLDCVDKFLRLNGRNKNLPFGGIQMVFIGDLYQLPPVVTGDEKRIFKEEYRSEYFFDANVFKDKNFDMDFIELEKIYRQKDEQFINVLNAIRNNSVTEKELEIINKRFIPDFKENPNDFYVYLTPTNKASYEINQRKLDELPGRLYNFKAEISGTFGKEYLPTETDLLLKVNSQVMLLNNDSAGRWVNGTIGRVVDVTKKRSAESEDDAEGILVKLETGEVEEVLPYKWKIFKFVFNEKTANIESETIGSFTQYPLKLAWSVTIHKSQGKTFDKVVIDIGRGTFTHGQMYVALSRGTTLEGMVLKKQIQKKHIWMDYRVVNFVTRYQYNISEKNCPIDKKIDILKNAIKNKNKISIVYLRNNDTKSRRVILPETIGEMEYLNKSFLGIKAFCFERNEDRVFRIDRILEIIET